MLRYIGGMVAARSVKAIGQEGKQERVIQARDAWWNELREEIKNHARSVPAHPPTRLPTHLPAARDETCAHASTGCGCASVLPMGGGAHPWW